MGGGPSAGRRRLALATLPVFLWACLPGNARSQETGDDLAERRRAMVEALADPDFGVPAVEDRRVLRAMRRVPRHRFVPERLRALAYADRPLPIGSDQTISQPYIVARMTELLELEPGEKVLEVGTGSGYQAAVLAEITGSVYTVEILPELAREARDRLEELGYGSVEIRIGNGYHGWAQHAPFDAIVVTAAPSHVPEPLVEQLAPGGRMVIPVGPQGGTQRLVLLEKASDGTVTRRELDPVRFVPLLEEGEPGGGAGGGGVEGDPIGAVGAGSEPSPNQSLDGRF